MLSQLSFCSFIIFFISCSSQPFQNKHKHFKPENRCDRGKMLEIDSKYITLVNSDTTYANLPAGIKMISTYDYTISDSLSGCLAWEIGTGFLDSVYNFQTDGSALKFYKYDNTFYIDILFVSSKENKYGFDFIVKKQDSVFLYLKPVQIKNAYFTEEFHKFSYTIDFDTLKFPVFISGNGL